MSDKTNFTDFSPELLGEVDGLYIKEVTSINDGDTLAIIDSEGASKEMGDLLPRPARNVQTVSINEDGDLVFDMDEEGIEYNAGRMTINEEVEEQFPEGFGVLTKGGSLKELVSNGRFKAVESDTSFEISMTPLEGVLPSNIINVEDPSKHQTFTLSEKYDIEDFVNNREISVAGNSFVIENDVTLYKGRNTFKLIACVTDSSMIDLVFKLAGTDTTYKHKSFSLDLASSTPRPFLDLVIDTVDDVQVDISVRLDSAESKLLFLDTDNLEATKEYELITLNIVNMKIDESKIVQYVPEEGNDLTARVETISNYLTRQPDDFKATALFNERVESGYFKVFRHGDKLIFTPKLSSKYMIKDLVTNEVSAIDNPHFPITASDYLKHENILYIKIPSVTNIEQLNLDTMEFSESTYRNNNSGTRLYWHHAENRLYQMNTSGAIYDYDLETGETMNNFPLTLADGSEVNPLVESNYFYTLSEEIIAIRAGQLYTRLEYATAYGKINLDSPGSVIYDADGELGVLQYDQYKLSDASLRLSATPNYASAFVGISTITNAYGEYMFSKAGTATFGYYNASWAEKPPWYMIQKTGRFALDVKGFEISLESWAGNPSNIAYPTKMRILGSEQAEVVTSEFEVIEETFSTSSSSDGRPFNIWQGAEHISSQPKYAWYYHLPDTFTTDMKREILIDSLTTQSVYARDIASYQDADTLILETSLDGESWTEAKFKKEAATESELEDLGFVELPELDGMDILGIRVRYDEVSYRQIYSFLPLSKTDGVFDEPTFAVPDEFPEGDDWNNFTTTDGSRWNSLESVSSNETYSLKALWHPTHSFYYPSGTSSTPTYLQVVFPEARRITTLAYNANDSSGEIAHLEYTLNGTDWIKFKSIDGNATKCTINKYPLETYTMKMLDYLDYKNRSVKLINPVLARYLRITAFCKEGSYFKIGRLYINRPTKEDWEVLVDIDRTEGELPEATERYMLPNNFTGSSLRVEVLEADKSSKTVYLNNVEILTDKNDRLIGNLVNMADGSERTFEQDVEFATEEAEKDFNSLTQSTMLNRGPTVIVEDGKIIAFMDYNYYIHKVVGNVIHERSRLYATRRTKNEFHYYHNGDLYLTAGIDGIEVTDLDAIPVREFGFSHLRITRDMVDSSNTTTLTIRDPDDHDTFFIFKRNDIAIMKASPRDKTFSFINLPTCPNTTSSTTRSLPVTSFVDKETGVIFCPPQSENGMIRIHPVGVEAKRKKFVNPVTGSISYLAFADGAGFPDSYMRMRYPNIPAINVDDPTIGFLPNYGQPYHNTTFTSNSTDEFYLSYEFADIIDFNGFEVYCGTLSNSNYQAPVETRIYTSEDGENWTLLVTVNSAEHGIRNNGGWKERIDVERTQTKHLKFEVDIEAGKSGCWMHNFLPVTDQEMFTTTEFNRATADEELIGKDDYGFTSDGSSSKYGLSFDLNDQYIISMGLTIGTPILYDKIAKTYAPAPTQLLDGDVTLGIYNAFKDYDDNLVLLKSNGEAFILQDDLSLEPYGVKFGTTPINPTYGPEGLLIMPEEYTSSLTLVNLANKMNVAVAYQENHVSRYDLGAMFYSGKSLFAFRRTTGGNDMISRYVVETLEGENLEIGTEFNANGLVDVKRLSNGDFFGVPYGEGKGLYKNTYLHFENTAGIVESDPDFEKIIELEG